MKWGYGRESERVVGNIKREESEKVKGRRGEIAQVLCYSLALLYVRINYSLKWQSDVVLECVSDPGEGVKGEDLSRKQWTTLNRLRTGVGRYKVSMKKWGLADSAACECGEPEQTADHIINSCPLHRPPSEAGIFEVGPLTRADWVSDLIWYDDTRKKKECAQETASYLQDDLLLNRACCWQSSVVSLWTGRTREVILYSDQKVVESIQGEVGLRQCPRMKGHRTTTAQWRQFMLQR